MGTSKHTPGPWVAEKADQFGDHNIILGNAVEVGDYRAVAAVVSNMRNPEEVEATARLIAASPDVVRSGRQLLDALENRAALPAYLKSAMAEFRAAIAKAEGRSDALLAARTKGEDNE